MITIHEEAMVPQSMSTLWRLFNTIEEYPRFVPFLKKAYRVGELKEGSIWYDITSVLWIPAKYQHVMTRIVLHKEVAFSVLLPFGGTMNQRFSFSPEENQTKVTGEIIFTLGNPLLDRLIGPVLKKRLTQMIIGIGVNVSQIKN